MKTTQFLAALPALALAAPPALAPAARPGSFNIAAPCVGIITLLLLTCLYSGVDV